MKRGWWWDRGSPRCSRSRLPDLDQRAFRSWRSQSPQCLLEKVYRAEVAAFQRQAQRPIAPATSAGTPGSISRPIRSSSSPSAVSTAPAVSPPPTTRRRTPSATAPTANFAKRVSIAWVTASLPYLCCAFATRSGSAVENTSGSLARFEATKRRRLCGETAGHHFVRFDGEPGVGGRVGRDLFARSRRAGT